MKEKRLRKLLLNCIKYINEAAGPSNVYAVLKDNVGFTESEMDELFIGPDLSDEEDVSKERVIQILQDYVNTDAEAAEPDYIRKMLTDTCGMTPDEIEMLGFGWLFPDGFDGEDANA